VKVSTNTTKFQHFFTNRVTNTWNSLPSHVVSAETINQFKNSLDKHFSKVIYDLRMSYTTISFSKAWMFPRVLSGHEVNIKMSTDNWLKAKKTSLESRKWYDMIWYDMIVWKLEGRSVYNFRDFLFQNNWIAVVVIFIMVCTLQQNAANSLWKIWRNLPRSRLRQVQWTILIQIQSSFYMN
jgi:hypothetical protein